MKIQKIFEIIEPVTKPDRSYRGTFKSADHDELSPIDQDKEAIGKRIGTGAFSSIKKNVNDPHTVTKYNHQFIYDDAFPQYVNFIYKNKLWENPYFPRVYSRQYIKDSEGKIIHKFEMENLRSNETLNSKEWQALITKMFGEDIFTILNSVYEEYSKHENEMNMYDSKASYISHKVSQILYAKINGQPVKPKSLDAYIKKYLEHYKELDISGIKIKDAKLYEAINQIREFLKKEPEAILDLHAGNYMIRRSPYGPQLVFTDPVAGPDEDNND